VYVLLALLPSTPDQVRLAVATPATTCNSM
jgi:hypothetical protein